MCEKFKQKKRIHTTLLYKFQTACKGWEKCDFFIFSYHLSLQIYAGLYIDWSLFVNIFFCSSPPGLAISTDWIRHSPNGGINAHFPGIIITGNLVTFKQARNLLSINMSWSCLTGSNLCETTELEDLVYSEMNWDKCWEAAVVNVAEEQIKKRQQCPCHQLTIQPYWHSDTFRGILKVRIIWFFFMF